MPVDIQIPLQAQHHYWDPDGTTGLNEFSYYGARKDLMTQVSYYREHPNIIPLKMLIRLIISVGVIYFVIRYSKNLIELLKVETDAAIYFSLIISSLILLPLWYLYKIISFQKDLINLLIAQHNNWLYQPNKNGGHWVRLAGRFPEIFQLGEMNQNMQQEFWGSIDSDGSRVDFYKAVFEFYFASYNHKYETYHPVKQIKKKILIIHLNNSVNCRFLLEPEGFQTRFVNFFKKRDIDVESWTFNNYFCVFYNGTRLENELEIVKKLSPAVQVLLVELRKKYGPFTVLIYQDTAVFQFKYHYFERMHTNFFREMAIDPRDVEKIEYLLKNLLNIAKDIVKYLD